MPSPAASHRVTTDPAGAPILVKQGREDDGRARLRGEAALLRALAHPGLVQVVDLVEDGEGTELHLAWVGPHSLATVTSVPVADAGRVVARVAEVVADLHDRGTTHGRLTADHVLLGRDAQPVLTGLAEAVGGRRGDPTADVGALGALLTRLVRPQQDGSMIPERRHRRRRDAGLAGALLTVADLAAADDPAIRPSARDLARRVRSVVDPVTRRTPRRAGRPRLRRADPPADPVAPRPPTGLDIGPVRIHREGPPAPAGDERLEPAGGHPPAPSPPGPATRPTSLPDPPAIDATGGGSASPVGADTTGGRGPSVHESPPERPSTGGPDPEVAAPTSRPSDAGADLGGPPLPRPGRRPAAAPSRPDPALPRAGVSRTLSPRSSAPDHHRAGRDRRGTEAPRPRRALVAALAAAILVSLVAAVALRPESPTEVAVGTLPTTTVDGGDARPLLPDDGSAPTAEEADRCPPVAPPAADIDGDGCPDALRIDRERVTAAGTTWVVGRPGDAVAVADWDCDGTATVASLRPSTGEVFVFDRWVTSGDELTVRAATTVPGAEALRAEDDDGDGCAALTAAAPDGSTTTVPVRSA